MELTFNVRAQTLRMILLLTPILTVVASVAYTMIVSR